MFQVDGSKRANVPCMNKSRDAKFPCNEFDWEGWLMGANGD